MLDINTAERQIYEMSRTIIEIQNVSKTYRMYEKKSDMLKEALSFSKKKYHKLYFALDDLCLAIQEGEIVGIVGENGAGKSTLLKLLTGVTTPTSGTISVQGKISALLELGAGFNPEYTGIENIFLNGMMMGFSHTEMKKKLEDIVKFADIGEFVYQPVKTYSSGMFARLAFAVAINVDPEILIVDEALSVGDMRFQLKCINRMTELMDKGTTILFVSHDINILRRFCQKGIWLDKGKLRMVGEINEVVDRYSDFLKSKNSIQETEERKLAHISMEKIWTKKFKPNSNIAELVGVKLVNEYGRIVTEVSINQPIKIVLAYDVYDESIRGAVAGIAIYGSDNEYICGLNTLLDQKKISWKYGRNEVELCYDKGICLVGGTYYITAAVFDRTATVAFEYIDRIGKFVVKDGYKGEGKVIIPHRWET